MAYLCAGMPPTRTVASCLAAAVALAAAAPLQAQALELRAPLTRSGAPAVPASLAGSVGAFLPDEATWAAMRGAAEIRLADVPIGPGRTVTLRLHPIEPFAPDATIVVAERRADGTVAERTIARPDAQYWGGEVEGSPGSGVMLARSAAGIHGFVQEASGTSVISSGPAGRGGAVATFATADLPEGAIDWAAWACDAIPAPGTAEILEPSGGHLVEPCRQVRVAVETDNEFYGRFAAAADPAAAATGYVGTIYAAMLQIYRRDIAALPQVGYLRLWASAADPWTATTTSTELSEFRNYWIANNASTSRNVAQFLSARALGGGIAWMNAVCGSYGYSVAGNLSGYFPYPLVDSSGQNWDIIVTSHEMGHNFGAPHTHSYCPPADSCAPSGYFGSCQTSQVCTGTGTIMSYCHLCSGGTANIQLVFHPQNIASMSAFLAGMPCNLTGSAQPPVAVPDAFTAFQGLATTLDPLANEADANCESIALGTFPATTAAGAALVRIPGTGGQRDTLRYTAPSTFSGTDTFAYQLLDASQQSATATVAVTVQPLIRATPVYGDVPQLEARYYELSAPTALPAFDTLAPYLGTTVPQVAFGSTTGAFATGGRADNVGAVFSGWVQVPTTGTWTFHVSSDDGSRLLIAGRTVVSNDGVRSAMAEQSGTVNLEAGKHPIRIEFFEATGGAGCIASLSGPGVAKAPIEASRLSRGGSSVPGDLNGDGRVDGADLGMLLAAWGTATAWADLDGDGTVGGADLGLLLARWTS